MFTTYSLRDIELDCSIRMIGCSVGFSQCEPLQNIVKYFLKPPGYAL